ncbi:MAG: N-acetyltransferase [Pseudomonadota bacterium]
MTERAIRPATPAYGPSIAALHDEAFGGRDEARIVEQLSRDGDLLLSWVLADDDLIIGHIAFFRILIDGADAGAGLGPMAVAPGHQKRGHGSALVRAGLTALTAQNQSIVFVLGHPTFYRTFGFDAARAEPFEAPWSGPAFMAKALRDDAPESGALTYPRAFTEP